ncbi:MAG: hypothetical protein ACTSPB_04790 [Candidatus Thorarchaeota archaeon]
MPTRIDVTEFTREQIITVMAIGDRLVCKPVCRWGAPTITRVITGFHRGYYKVRSIDGGRPMITYNGRNFVVKWHEIKAVIKKEQG